MHITPQFIYFHILVFEYGLLIIVRYFRSHKVDIHDFLPFSFNIHSIYLKGFLVIEFIGKAAPSMFRPSIPSSFHIEVFPSIFHQLFTLFQAKVF